MSVQAPPVSPVIDCRLFGSLSVFSGGTERDLGGPKQRLVLAILLSHANASVSLDTLIDALWPAGPPRTARKNVQVYVSQLRKIFGDRLATCGRGLGYRLQLTPEECDLVRFRRLTETGRAALREGDRTLAAELLGRGIRVWSGQPFAEFAYEPCLADEVDNLVERFLAVLEDWAEIEVDRCSYRDVLELLDRVARRYPLRERLAAARMRALAATGRCGDALAHFEFVRKELARELGTDPSRSLADVHRRLLRGEEPVPAPAGAPAVRPPTVFTQLPRDLTDFVGREAQTDRVAEIFADERGHDTVVVSGEIGIGKTAFAVRIANLLAPSFPDGRILLELEDADGAPKSTAAVLEELLGIIGLGGAGGRAVSYSMALWRSWVAERRLLLILDGAVRENVVTDLLPGSSRNRAIVTSRRRLSGLASVQRVELPPLAEAESSELFGRIAGAGRCLADRGSAEEILRRCAGVPLAVRIVGAKLAALRHVRLADFLLRLRDPGAELDELRVGELDVRSRYLAFYRTLSPAQQQAYLRLARLPGRPFTDLPARGVLEALLECGLLTVSDAEPRYDMPRLAYLFGRVSATGGLDEEVAEGVQ